MLAIKVDFALTIRVESSLTIETLTTLTPRYLIERLNVSARRKTGIKSNIMVIDINFLLIAVIDDF